MYFLPNNLRAYTNMQAAIGVLSNMKKKVRKTGIFIQKFKDILSNSDSNALLTSVLIVYEHVDMKDNRVVITKIPMWFSENFH